MKIIIILVLVILFLWLIGSWFFIRNIEEPKYEVLSKKDGYEIMEYESYLIAETTIDGSYEKSFNQGFGIIADYIFGNNTKSQKIAMTSPVIDTGSKSDSEKEFEKIAMTVPVINKVEGNDRKISFVMPSKYTIETIPKPNSDLVTLKEVPARKVAVLRYTWYSNEKRVEDKKQKLSEMLERDNVETVGDFYSAFYNPPLSMPLILRNEILVDLK